MGAGGDLGVVSCPGGGKGGDVCKETGIAETGVAIDCWWFVCGLWGTVKSRSMLLGGWAAFVVAGVVKHFAVGAMPVGGGLGQGYCLPSYVMLLDVGVGS